MLTILNEEERAIGLSTILMQMWVHKMIVAFWIMILLSSSVQAVLSHYSYQVVIIHFLRQQMYMVDQS